MPEFRKKTDHIYLNVLSNTFAAFALTKCLYISENSARQVMEHALLNDESEYMTNQWPY